MQRYWTHVKGGLSGLHWAATADFWLFVSGVVAGLGGNAFTTRALMGDSGRDVLRMWLEFAVFLAASALAIAVSVARRSVEEKWKAGGADPRARARFVEPELGRLTLRAFGFLTLVAIALLSLLVS